MMYERLQVIYKKKRRLERLSIALVILMAIMILTIFPIVISEYFESRELLFLFIAVAIICDVLVIMFRSKISKYNRMSEDYIIIKIMDIITEYGIAIDNFEIVEEVGYGYRVGFHNQTVDYDKLQSKLDTELKTMNEISGKSIRVKLI